MRAILGGVLGKIPRPTPAMAVALFALFVAASGTAVAAISYTDNNGNIRACGDNRTGALRVLQSTQNCTSKETPVNWVNGLQGSQVADSAKLGGQLPSAFLGANQKAADADQLDGKDSSAYLPGDLPSGTTVRGWYAIQQDGDSASLPAESYGMDAISFGYRMSSIPESRYVPGGKPAPEGCSGDAWDPQAAPGYLCVFQMGSGNATYTGTPVLSRDGAILTASSLSAGSFNEYGTWAVTAR